MKFVKKTNYYTGVVYEWNLPVGFSCPSALECLVKVDRITGKFENKSNAYRCYASSSERFPAVREHRWKNFDFARQGGIIELPVKANSIRIHMAGDFFAQHYFDMWLQVCRDNPNKEFWAYTKSVNYWVSRLNEIPKNLILTASYGGKHDHLIEEYDLKNVIVYPSPKDVPSDREIDYNDDLARIPNIKFALLDNLKNKKPNV